MCSKELFKQKDEIILSAHTRANLIGKHTDYTE